MSYPYVLLVLALDSLYTDLILASLPRHDRSANRIVTLSRLDTQSQYATPIQH